jgi:23S rRNA pseudouridine2605 synthase
MPLITIDSQILQKLLKRLHSPALLLYQTDMIDKSKTGGTGPRKPFSSADRTGKPRKSASPRRILEEIVPTEASADSSDRIAKVMARAGLCSRRDAEQWIADGRVSVNGTVILSPALNITARDKVVVDGQPLAAAEPTRLFMFHKPRGTVTTDRDPEGRPTIFEVLPEGLPRVMTIGRLDINTEGLLLLTNDGGLARQLELPATGWLRRYRVRAHGETDQAVLDSLREGITIEGIHYAGIEAQIDRVQGSNMWLTMGLREGKNREIKRVLEHLGLAVTRLIRISFGPFQLLELKEGAVEEVKTRVLKDQLGEALIAEAGCIFADESAPAAPRVTAARTLSERPASGARPQMRGESRERSSERGYVADKKPPFERKARGEMSSEQDFTHDYAGELDRPVPGTRKHVKTLRAIKDVAQRTGPRQTITRDKTQDRNGRIVTVERVARPSIRPVLEPDSRNAKRFAAGNAAAEGEIPTGRIRTKRQSDMVREKKAEAKGHDPKPFNRGTAEKKPFRKRDDAYEERPITGRSFEKRQLSARSYQGKEATPSRDGFNGPRSDARTARSAEGRSFGAKSYGDRPSSGKPAGGRPTGGRPSGDRPSGGRPSGGGKPFGGKPSGPRGRDR